MTLILQYWLVKSEPDVYSIDYFARDQLEIWDGVRNYQARNFLKSMQLGDRVFFYHSNTKYPAIVGLGEVQETNVIDPTQFDVTSPYFDPKSQPTAPRWQTVQLQFLKKFDYPVSLQEMKARFSPNDLFLVKPGNRLSVMPIVASIAEFIMLQSAIEHSL